MVSTTNTQMTINWLRTRVQIRYIEEGALAPSFFVS